MCISACNRLVVQHAQMLGYELQGNNLQAGWWLLAQLSSNTALAP